MRTFCAALAAVGLLGSGPGVRAELADAIRAIVHDAVITGQEVEGSVDMQTLRRQYGSQFGVLEEKYQAAVNDNLERLLEDQLILHDFKTAGYNLPESIIDEVVQERIRRRYGDRATLTKTLQAQGITYEKFRQQVRDSFIIEQMRLKNISSEIIISPHKLETYYLDHKDEFKVEDEVKLRMIVLNKASSDDQQVRPMAEEILAKLKEGAAFSEMASVYSQGSQRSQGGDWGWVEKSVLRKELAATAFSLKPGELSGVIEMPEACYLMLVEETRPAHTKALGEVRDELERTLLTQERARLQKQWIDRLKKKTFILTFPF